jgi:V/A-type H+-transporting ATPase subunit A
MGLFDQGAEMIELGAPVQELAEHPILARVRRAKSTWRSDELEQFDAFAREAREAFDEMHAAYDEKREVEHE